MGGRLLVGLVLLCICITINSYGTSRIQHRCLYRSNNLIMNKLLLNAKKKGNKLISDDILAALDEEITKSEQTEVIAPTSASASQPENSNKKKKDKKLTKLGLSDSLFEQIETNLEVLDASSTVKSKSASIDGDILVKNKQVSIDNPSPIEVPMDSGKTLIPTKSNDIVTMDEAVTVPISKLDDSSAGSNSGISSSSSNNKPTGVTTNELTVEQQVRRDKPPSRVKFAESSQPDFVMMGLENVGLIFGNEVVIKDASFSVSTGERVGLVGPNGAGKTSQLKVLAGVIEPTTGTVVKSSKNLRTAFLRQEFIDELVLTRQLKDELYASFEEEQQLLKDIAQCEIDVAKTTDNPEEMEEVLNRLQKLQDQAISKGVYSLDSKVEKIMNAMGFDPEDGTREVSSFSGGWKMRIGLAKILLKDPNILLLDEPTNHLDLDSVFWLEDFLQKQNIPMVVVSHDREFLDRVCNKIIDVEDGKTVSYQGNYSKFLEQRRIRLELWRDKYEKQLRHVKEEENWIKKAKNDPNLSQQVKAKETALEKYKTSEDWVEQPPKDKKFRFRFPPAPRCGTSVIEVNKLTHGYGDGKYKTLFQDVDIQVDRGNRVGFVGPNGSGKSTMMRIIAGNEQPRSGYAEFGSGNVVLNYFQQNQADELDLEKTVLETVQAAAPEDMSFTDTRALLGQFMFKGDDVDKKIHMLSGGEKARVALCKMMLSPANLLLLDEPTNHLDITSKEVLEDALLNFEGSVMIISHDRYFMSQVVNTIFSFENKSVYRHDCDYHDFMNSQGTLRDKVMSRYVEGDKYKITNSKEVFIEETKSKKNFGGSGVTSGNLNKGIKNAKRYQG